MRMCACKFSLLAMAVLLHGALAARSSKSLFSHTVKAPSMKSLVSGVDTICGGPEIWRMMTATPTVSGVQNIKWEMIDTLAEDHISIQEALVKQLEEELKSLAARIQEKKEQEQAKGMNLDGVRDLIKSGVVEFGGLEDAQRTKCGKPGIRPRGPRGAYRKSEAAFGSAAEAYFTGDLRVDGAEFLRVCDEMLPKGEDSYCGQLCQSFKDKAQEFSDITAGETAGKASDELVREEKDKLEALAKAQQEVSQCKHSRESIDGFKAQLEELKRGIDDRFDDLRAAEMALDDAAWDLDDLEELLETEEQATAEALQVLETAEVDVEDAKSSLLALQGEEKALQEQVKSSAQTLQTMTQKLVAAKNADKVVDQLKGAVSMTSLKMGLFFDKAVLEPVRDVGLGEYLDLTEYFEEDPSKIESAGTMQKFVTSLDEFCKGEAKSAFDAVKNQVDLSPLCTFGEVDDINSELGTAVVTRMHAIQQQIEKVKSWLNPYNGQSAMTAARAQELVNAGEPKGIQEIVGVYSGTEFYQYLKEWELKGSFLKLIAKLKDVVSSLDASVHKLSQELADLKERLKQTLAARELAETSLEEATKAQGLAADKKAEMDKKVAQLKDQSAKLQKDVSTFEADVEHAKKMYKGAKGKLLAAHEESTSLLESWVEEETSEMLEAQTAQSRQQISLLRDALQDARMSYEAIEAKITSAHRA